MTVIDEKLSSINYRVKCSSLTLDCTEFYSSCISTVRRFIYCIVITDHINKSKSYLTSLHDQNKSGFFGGPAFIHPIRTI